MKKILFTLLSLLCVTSAWAGTGNGTKEHPYTGEWDGQVLGPDLKEGDHLAYDFVINNVFIPSITDSKLHKDIAITVTDWSPRDAIGESPISQYTEYCTDNPLDNRKRQTFIITYVSMGLYKLEIEGYFSGFYRIPDADGFVRVATTEQMWKIIKDNDHAKVMLTQDICLSDINKDNETYCNTFSGILDGDGHTIKGDPEVSVRARTYMFTYAEGATFRNLTFKGIRVNSQSHSNQAIITSQAKNNCVFENITFDNVHSFSNYNNVGAAAGYAYNSTFKNIKVINSDFTVDDNYVGSLVGDADKCTFTNIEITNCDTYAHDDCAGGVVGHSRNCAFQDVTVHSGYFKADGIWAGGVAGKAVDVSTFTNCVTEDQVAIFADGTMNLEWNSDFPGLTDSGTAEAGGIVGHAVGGTFQNCINSAIILANYDYVGGIVGYIEPYRKSRPNISGCLNTGMLIHPKSESKASEYITKYKTKQMPYITKHYGGKEYTIRTTGDDKPEIAKMGGMAGFADSVDISQCANIGSLYAMHSIGGIVGTTRSCYICDCLSAYHFNSEDASSVWGTYRSRKDTKVANCLAALPVGSVYPQGYYAHILDYLGDSNNRIKTNEAEVASGKICHNLGENWEQHLGIDPYPTPTGNKGVYHTRTVSNEYGTLCLPYALKSDNNISYYTFTESADSNGEVTLNFDYAETVEPGTPVLFRVADTGEITFSDGYVINDRWADSPVAPESATWNFTGTFEERNFTGDATQTIYYVSDGAIKHSSSKVTIAPFRAYFEGPSIETLTSNGSTQARVRIVIDGEENEEAALQLVGDDFLFNGRGEATYTLFGTKAGEGYRGIVVRDGKKMLSL